MILRTCLMMLASIVAGCTSRSPSLYTLEPVQGAARIGAPSIIVVTAVEVPRYLEREEIVRVEAGGRLVVADNDWWSEPLGVMLRRVMVQDIAQRLPASNVLPGESLIGLVPDVAIAISVEQFDREATGQVTLVGHAVFNHKNQSRSLEPIHIVVPGIGPSTVDQVDTMSLAVSKAADVLAENLAP